jgi:formyltetrahydrofolate deformylase
MKSHVLTVSCQSTRGIVAAITGYLAEKGCYISDSSQFDDLETGLFFMRLTFLSQEGVSEEDIKQGFTPVAKPFGMTYRFNDSDERMKVLLMVSRFGHCLNDLLYRWKIGALPIDIVGVVSNHFDYQKVIVNHDIPFHHIKVTKENKPQAEARLMEVVEQSGAELIVLARYMQVLSDAVCKKMSGRIINIHHSFLPSFKGANPYKQAFERGVKLIGATAHYVTEDLDEGADHRAGRGAHHTCAVGGGLCVDRPGRGEPGACPRGACAYPPPHLHERQQDHRLPAEPRFLRLRAHGLNHGGYDAH